MQKNYIANLCSAILKGNVQKWKVLWNNFLQDLVLNLTPQYRDVRAYRTTLAHKANHKA
jgi:hypothetical protein